MGFNEVMEINVQNMEVVENDGTHSISFEQTHWPFGAHNPKIFSLKETLTAVIFHSSRLTLTCMG